MAYEIPSDFVLPAGRLLIQLTEDDDDCCVADIVRVGEDKNWGCFPKAFRYSVYTKIKRVIDNPDYVPSEPPEEPPERPGQIIIDYARIIFNRLTAQEVKIGAEDYFLIHVIDILGLIPPE
jgi:hypothetical protein